MKKNELIWFFGLLLFFITVLLMVGSPNFYELVIIGVTYTINWLIMSNILKKVNTGELLRESQMKELSWYGGILVGFLALLVIVGSPTYTEIIITTTAFTFIWIIRSLIAKKFAPTSNVSTA